MKIKVNGKNEGSGVMRWYTPCAFFHFQFTPQDFRHLGKLDNFKWLCHFLTKGAGGINLLKKRRLRFITGNLLFLPLENEELFSEPFSHYRSPYMS